MYRVIHSTSNNGLSFVVGSYRTRERAELRARRLADQVVTLYGKARAERYERWDSLPLYDQLTTGYGVVIGGDRIPLHVHFDVVGPDDAGDLLSYSRHIEGN